MTSDASPLLSVQGLSVRYRTTQAVAGVDLAITPGEVVGLIGPDGAGKSSTLRVLAGLQRPSGGRVTAFGQPVWEQRRALHHRVGYLAQRFALYGDLTVDENVQFFSRLYGMSGWRAKRDDLLRRVGLAPFRDRLAEHLSGGMKQKLALACTLIHDPELLILDEPTTGVDPLTRRELWRLLGELVANGLTLLVATPYLEEAERCSRVLLLRGGRVLAEGSPAALKALLPGQVVRIEGGQRAAVLAALAGREGIADVAVFGAAVHARTGAPLGAATRLVAAALAEAGVGVDRVHEIPATLEDVFLYYATRHPGAPGKEAA